MKKRIKLKKILQIFQRVDLINLFYPTILNGEKIAKIYDKGDYGRIP